jgi:hypothetical protein
MPEERTMEKVFKNTPDGKGSVVKPRKGWLNDVKKMGVTRLKKEIFKDGNA